jgi:hypothetical protein
LSSACALFAIAAVACTSGKPSESTHPENAFEHAVRSVLGDKWRISRGRGNEILIERKAASVIINLMGRSPREIRDLYALDTPLAKQRYLSRFEVPLAFRLVARTGLKLDQAEVEHLLSKNRKAGAELSELSKYEQSLSEKIDLGPDGPRLESRYFAVWHKIREIPAGYFEDVSVYLAKTNLGNARFLSAEDEAAHQKAVLAILRMVDKYRGVKHRTTSDDVCKYNRKGETVPISCPW